MKKLTTSDRIKQGKPLETWTSRDGTWVWNVYRKYKRSTEAELKDKYSRWFCGVTSPFTYGSEELGDCYVADVKGYAHRTFVEGAYQGE